MKLRSLFTIAALALGTVSGMAQATYTAKDGTEYTFKKHLFLDLQGGAQYTLGEAKFDKLISPNVQLGLGYQFNPWFGARLQANAWQSKGGYNGIDENGKPVPVTSTYKFKYVAPGLDFMFNLSNLFCGWNPNRVFNVTAFLGGGANIAWANDDAVAMHAGNGVVMRYLWDGTKVKAFGRGGIDLNFRVSDAVSIMVEGNANILNDRYNSKKAGNADWYFNALAGLRINLGKTYTKKAPEPEPEPAPEPVKEEVVAPAPAPAPAPVQKVEPIRRDVFFRINRYLVTTQEQSKVEDIVNYLNEHPDAKVTVTGYADAGTGNDVINDRIAKRRADAVTKMLMDKGVAADRITTDSKGARVQPFAENDKNRVSIMIAE